MLGHLACCKCHHEWDGALDSRCDWCGAPSRVLACGTMLADYLRASRPAIDQPLGDIPDNR